MMKMLRDGLNGYSELRKKAVGNYKEIKAKKVLKPKFKIIVEELKTGMVNVKLAFSAWYVYENNHTHNAKAYKYWDTILVGDCDKDSAMKMIAPHAKGQIENNTINKDVDIMFMKYEEELI